MIKRPIKRIGTVAGTLSAALLLTVTQASAASSEVERATATTGPANGDSWECSPHYSDQRAQICYEDVGDWFEVMDGEPDGYSAVAQWETISPQGKVTRWGLIFNASGAATTRYKNKDFAENDTIRFRACLGHWTTKLIDANKCSAWRSMNT
ncbi:hypothetical protein PUR28_18390 [Streptomyces sp. BE308]|uniref:hypothetical protein n=1 Tax=Streptomyces sp. BE308 TaxID=3002529 RepID=UPI002E7875A1|nr:hypothetical protein [Streptomyces sp. BE308]MEE1792712.1 hypothetical protein [Streptomyces sp. BE308]